MYYRLSFFKGHLTNTNLESTVNDQCRNSLDELGTDRNYKCTCFTSNNGLITEQSP